jgi:hypothetical protein
MSRRINSTSSAPIRRRRMMSSVSTRPLWQAQVCDAGFFFGSANNSILADCQSAAYL